MTQQTATQVSQYGITWEFDGEYAVGQYASGDWWVEGPVTITEITPESTEVDGRVVNGTMLDPVGSDQGYDSFDSDMDYVADLNVDPGATGEELVVNEGAVVSSISLDSPDSNGRPVLSDLAILTVVGEQPPADAFRPGPYSEGTTAQWTESDLDYGVLRSLPTVDSAPDLDAVTESVERFWNEQNTNWTARPVHAENNQAIYGREIAYELGAALLSLHLDYPESDKRDLFVNMVQRGIDIYDRAQIGGVWNDDGGHNHGRKMPMLFAGLALDADPIVAMADAEEQFIFQEDRQTFVVSEDDVGRELIDDQYDRETYREEDVGMPEWGVKHASWPNRDDRCWEARYRGITGTGFMHHALTAHVMGSATEPGKSATTDWNYPAFFEYVDRFVRKGSPSDANGIRTFAQEFWDAYREINQTATQVSQHGITWEFDGEYTVGQYADSDWWVEGPVTITKITPESTEVDGRVMHGTMLDPVGGDQGYDSYDSDMGYDPDLNVDPGATGEELVVNEGSVVSSISLDSPDSDGLPVLSDLAILTVVTEPPPSDAFRPGPYSEGTAAQWTESDFDYGVLKSLPLLDSAPDLDAVTESIERFWNEQNTSWTARVVHASNNQPNYGREIAYVLGEALLSLHLNYTEWVKRDLFVNLVQRGLDIYDRARIGGAWKDNGGHNHGRKMPMLFAGLALDDDDITAWANADEHLVFQEDRQTFFVSDEDVGREMEGDRETYREEDLGMPEWGAKHTRQPSRDDRRWGASYRWVGSGFMYHALAAHVMESATQPGASAAADWNHPPFFEYVDRYVRKGSPSSGETNGIQPFAGEFWNEYRTASGPVTVTASGETIPSGGRATLSLTAEPVEVVIFQDLWTDWSVVVNDLAGATTTDNRVGSMGELELDWDPAQAAAAPSITVEPPAETYVGGTYAIDVVAEGDGDSATDTAVLEIQSEEG